MAKLKIPLLVFFFITISTSAEPRSQPNFVLFLVDDMGYGDLSSYGHPTQEDGAVDRLAREGLKLTQVYAAAACCTPSRASLMTGRQPFRTGMTGPTCVHLPHQRYGLPHEEVTIADGLQKLGYRTGMVGKWHLGINNETSSDGSYLPHTHGFDYVGTFLPFSLATWCDVDQEFVPQPNRHMCFLYRDREIIQQPIDLTQLTPAIVSDAKAFLHDVGEEPFFLYFSFPQTHTAMFNMPGFKGKSKRGPYGDQLNEVSWAVDEIMQTLKDLGLENDTLTMFTSDHGPHLEMCHWGGSAGPLAGGKPMYLDGGLRVPGILHWPGIIPPGSVSTEVISLMDVFPSFLQLAGGQAPQDRTVDGRSFVDALLYGDVGEGREALFIYDSAHDMLSAVRYKQYKIYFTTQPNITSDQFASNCVDGVPQRDFYFGFHHHTPRTLSQPRIYNIERDPGEREELDPGRYTDILQEVSELLEVEKLTWDERREAHLHLRQTDKALIPCCNPPYCFCGYRDQTLADLSNVGVCNNRTSTGL